MFENIPFELKNWQQWVVWRREIRDGLPTKVPYNAATGRRADVTSPGDWNTFEQSINAAPYFDGIGFCLSEADPYAFIDLDDASDHPEAVQIQRQIYEQFKGYVELSPSGKGAHIILKGSVPKGAKSRKIEIYSSNRFMTMTGNILRAGQIIEQNELLNLLWAEIKPPPSIVDENFNGSPYEKFDDEKILEIACNAENSQKFIALFYDGDWSGQGYPSQSEADFALIDIIAFYSENREQTKRLFLNSKLGQREKSRAEYRLKRTLDRCFDRMLPPINLDFLNARFEEEQKKKRVEKVLTKKQKEPFEPYFNENPYTCPPGLVGEFAQFIYEKSTGPVAEIAIAGALGFMAGICGRSYNISDTGLNLYLYVLASTGTGKEAPAAAIDAVMSGVVKFIPKAASFVGPSEIQSPQALNKYLMRSQTKSFLVRWGEFGLRLPQMHSKYANPALGGLKTMLLDLFAKSGKNRTMGESIYSEKEKTVDSIISPAVSIFGETTPERFYENLSEDMITEGFLSRWVGIEYCGPSPAYNENHNSAKPSDDLINKFANVISYSLSRNEAPQDVGMTPQADDYLRRFKCYEREQVANSNKEVYRNLWNRAHLISMKIAALVAIGQSFFDPVISENDAKWAVEIVCKHIRHLSDKFAAGEIGENNEEQKQLRRLLVVLKAYFSETEESIIKFCGEKLKEAPKHNIVLYTYIQRYLANDSVFKRDKLGATTAIKRALKTAIEIGYIVEIPRNSMQEKLNTNSLGYGIINWEF